jgi:hypothetical protein
MTLQEREDLAVRSVTVGLLGLFSVTATLCACSGGGSSNAPPLGASQATQAQITTSTRPLGASQGTQPQIKTSTPPATTVATRTLLTDKFDSDAAGSFPIGWSLLYNGAGTNLQVVDTTHFVSKPNSLKLVGSACWSANAYHPLTLPGPVTGVHLPVLFSASIFVGQIGTGGCDRSIAGMNLYNPSIGTWGTNYAGVDFESDGFIYGFSGGTHLPKLMPYSVNKWYSITVDADLSYQTSDIYINGVLVAPGLPFPGTGLPTGVEVWAGHGNRPTAWFDNILVQTAPTATPTPVVYNAATAFEQGWTSHSNHNGVWSYGYSSGFASAVTLYDQTAQNGINGPKAQYWLSSSVDDANSPAAEYNDGPAYNDGNVDFTANEFLLVAGIRGQYSDLIFTAPSAGSYSVASTFSGSQYGVGTVVAVVANGAIVFNSSVTRVNQTVPFSITVRLTAGQTIEFSVGPGGGLQNTGLAVTIEKL